jgi:hypothetical protein
MIFWRKIVIFHTKYPNNFRASLRSAQFFYVRPLTWNPGSDNWTNGQQKSYIPQSFFGGGIQILSKIYFRNLKKIYISCKSSVGSSLASYFVLFSLISLVSFYFVFISLISFRFVSFSLISFRFYFVSHFIGTRKKWQECNTLFIKYLKLCISWMAPRKKWNCHGKLLHTHPLLFLYLWDNKKLVTNNKKRLNSYIWHNIKYINQNLTYDETIAPLLYL